MSHRDLLVTDENGYVTTNRAYYGRGPFEPTPSDPPVTGFDHTPPDKTPPWAEGDMPVAKDYTSDEQFVAGGISTEPPFNTYHPCWALPHARKAIANFHAWDVEQGRDD